MRQSRPMGGPVPMRQVPHGANRSASQNSMGARPAMVQQVIQQGIPQISIRQAPPAMQFPKGLRSMPAVIPGAQVKIMFG